MHKHFLIGCVTLLVLSACGGKEIPALETDTLKVL